MSTEIARAEAEKFRVHILNVALAASAGKQGDLREATEMLIGGIAQSLDRFSELKERIGDANPPVEWPR